MVLVCRMPSFRRPKTALKSELNGQIFSHSVPIWFQVLVFGRGIHLACFFASIFLVGGCSPSCFHMFIGFATVFIDFLKFWGVLSIIFPNVHRFCNGVYGFSSMCVVSSRCVFRRFSLVVHRFLVVFH